MNDEDRGERRFRDALRRLASSPAAPEMPKPSDPWGVWVEYRLKRLEDEQRWMIRVILAALVGQFAIELIKLV